MKTNDDVAPVAGALGDPAQSSGSNRSSVAVSGLSPEKVWRAWDSVGALGV
jgi:hypothetical protein